LWRAKTIPSWELSDAALFDDVSLPTIDTSLLTQKLELEWTTYALAQAGFPYIWGGEWGSPTPPGYCCGYQAKGGFDCSGFMWWVMKKNESGYNSAQFRTYPGWSLPERTSSDMAHNTTTQLAFTDLKPGNLMFFATDGGHTWQDVDHVGLYLGN